MVALGDRERQLLDRLAAEGKPTRLVGEDLLIAKALEEADLVYVIHGTFDAVITPKGRRMLADMEKKPKPGKPPFGFLD